MRPIPSFSLHRPKTLSEALELLQALEDARPIAGGTDLLVLLRDGAVSAKHLIDLGGVHELQYIREENDEIRIGAATTHAQLLRSELIAEKTPLLHEAAASIGSVQIRNRGTLGGNLCNASPAADTAPPLLALNAEAAVASTGGTRIIPLGDLFAGPKMNSLRPGELLTEIRFPTPPAGSGTSFQKLGRRRGLTLAVINVAVYLCLEGGVCREARIALGAVAATPIRMPAAEEMLEGRQLSGELIEAAASACRDQVRPIDDIRASAEYRREMAYVLTRRALMDAWERARRDTL
ncbi:xanthine dehydrogenase family protein subunit M [Candidatus Bathyarchaeota archaeon]|nr:MAG: xanthine dehydrogenase family protein subunit M [Candidatus Bathyarchaeota archaeon]